MGEAIPDQTLWGPLAGTEIHTMSGDRLDPKCCDSLGIWIQCVAMGCQCLHRVTFVCLTGGYVFVSTG